MVTITTIKRKLQKHGSKSSKRHLKKLSGKEARFKRNMNHIISKKIVSKAKDTSSVIALEDLKGFNGRNTVQKAERERFGKWAFNQLRSFIEYKAKLAGILVIIVNPRNTSRTCSVCGCVSKQNRKSQAVFSCIECGMSMHADFNAALNIASKAQVNMPIAVHVVNPIAPTPGTASLRL